MAGKLGRIAVLALLVAALGGALMAYASNNVPEGAKYVGVAKCRLCHLEQYNTWKETKHATAFSALEGPEVKDADCVKCHTVGYGKPGGFVDHETTAAMENVGCEDCHGPGSAHVENAAKNLGTEGPWEKMINKVPDNTCVGCHNTHVNQKQRAMDLRAKRGG
jgi:hypothetical protein